MKDAGADERRTAIIQAAWQVIAENGMSAVSMRTVAAAANVSVGRIQYWFRTKDELLRASLEAMLSGAGELHDADTKEVDDLATLRQLLAQPVSRAGTTLVGISVFHQYVAAAITHPALAHLLAEAKDGAEREAARLLGAIVPDLDDPRTVARTLIATADGLTMRVLIGSVSAAEAEEILHAEVDRLTARTLP